ncbi:MATE family efflux transporter [Fusibacter paucivorans]|uniref:Probable multidrug resistance protein NorM n=1 Tax=Fusibacter paucivorans TaxID=76009 RepID=A0ABS5PLR4_9FIRM|nr:MATE family efflux transporter [Fusibacter paucivorans]MBS7525867.1 MATE family efflux transporter [Fusibacter paucivorans]
MDSVDYRLTEGAIVKKLLKLTLPIMGTSFLQMAYNLTDMFWIGFMGSKAVAALGIAGFFSWLSMAFVLISRVGTEIRVAQLVGGDRDKEAKTIARTGVQLTAVMGIVYAIAVYVFRYPLIGFFNTQDAQVEGMSIAYLSIICIGFIGLFLNQVFTGLFNAVGNSRTPFVFNTIGLVLNMVLDPVLILGFGRIPGLGVKGAAIATVFAQLSVMMLFLFSILGRQMLMKSFTLFGSPKLSHLLEIIRMGVPPAVQSGIFTIISMIIARLIADFGPTPVAVQKVGSQIESISWMTASGFSVALSAFIGQNFGAEKRDRVYEGYKKAMQIAIVLGVFTTLLLYFGARPLFMIFIREPDAVAYGIDYLKILALSQLFMCVEITASGIFNGLGHTKPPAFIGVCFNVLRIPIALWFTNYLGWGINGIWWSITISSVLKGVVAYLWLQSVLKQTQIASSPHLS